MTINEQDKPHGILDHTCSWDRFNALLARYAIPKPFIEQCGLEEQVEMSVQDCMILIHAPRQPRVGWGDAFARMARAGDDKLQDGQRPDRNVPKMKPQQ